MTTPTRKLETTHSVERTRTQELADFVVDTPYEALPADVIDVAKLLILDSMICGIAAASAERTRMLHRVVVRLGGSPDANIFGLSGQRFPAVWAAAANAEIMNFLDADDTFYNATHFAVFNVAGALAEAQRLGTSGKAVIRGVALGYDVNSRLELASRKIEVKEGGLRWSPIQGMGYAAFGTAASAGAVAGFDREKMRNAFGLCAWGAPTPTVAGMHDRTAFGSMKCANNAAAAHAGMLSALLADEGYVGDQDVLDTTPGFLEAQGAVATDRELMMEELGEKWWILEAAVKYYPSCRYTHGPIDAIRGLIERERLEPEEIERIDVRVNPMAHGMKIFSVPIDAIPRDHRGPLSSEFNIPYVLALAALGRTPGPNWHTRENLEDPKVRALAARVHLGLDPQLADEAVRAVRDTRIGRFPKTRRSLTVRARGKDHVFEGDFASGDPWSRETKPNWQRVRQKLDEFCEGILSEAARRELADRIQGLESAKDIAKELEF
ncbi:MAG: MmgE/PrpD family protein [Gammaproteobacteria bacterium]|nr:MmgE/PrpD family protein [Gammaproteobacteria bacterium]